MSETKHTPGPWQQNPAAPEEIMSEGECMVIARVPFAKTGLYNKSAPANARLIAAPPDMLGALKSVLSPDGNSVYATTAVITKIRDAITRAEGRTP